MPQIADWPPTRADAQHILNQHPAAPPQEIHTCKVCGDAYWGQRATNGRIRRFCSKRCYYKHNDSSPGFQRYRATPKGKAMRQKIMAKHQQKPEAKEKALLRARQFARWQQVVYTLDPSQKPQSPWASCSTSDCHNIPTKKMAHLCSGCLRDSQVANRPNTWRNADKPCKAGCGKQIGCYQQKTCGNKDCIKLLLRQCPKKKATRQRHKQARRARKLAAFVEQVDVMVLCQQQDRDCWLCGGKIRLDKKAPHPKSLSLDHLVPLSLGGEHSYRNCAAAHFGCNSRKQAKAMNEQLKLV